MALGSYESIIETGFDIEEILNSYNQNLKEKGLGYKEANKFTEKELESKAVSEIHGTDEGVAER